jgi:hypothetical protein
VLKLSLELVNPAAPTGNPRPAAWTKEFKVTFSQINITKYMDINCSRFVNPCSDGHKPNQRCFIVTYKRLGDDPFTEPIRADQWKCRIVEKNAAGQDMYVKDASGDPKGWVYPGDSGLGFHYYPAEPGGNYAWSGDIENEQVEGTVGNWSRKKKQ